MADAGADSAPSGPGSPQTGPPSPGPPGKGDWKGGGGKGLYGQCVDRGPRAIRERIFGKILGLLWAPGGGGREAPGGRGPGRPREGPGIKPRILSKLLSRRAQQETNHLTRQYQTNRNHFHHPGAPQLPGCGCQAPLGSHGLSGAPSGSLGFPQDSLRLPRVPWVPPWLPGPPWGRGGEHFYM